MIVQHKDLAQGRWSKMSFVEQMANVGSEVDRALSWRVKNNNAYSQKAFERALELLDLTLVYQSAFPRLRELTRVREVMVDYFFGINEFASTDVSMRRYFFCFTFAARKDR